jgi:ABC-type nitrate/sulfonate/bicarbonate transport system substrate-binding protein
MIEEARMNAMRGLWWKVASLLLVSAVAASAQAAKSDTIRVVSFGHPLPIVMAQKHGFFAKYHVHVVMLPPPPSSTAMRGEIASGKADIAHAAVDNAVALNQPGKPAVIVVIGGELSLNVLMAQPGIHSFAQLRGRTTIVDAPNTAFALQLMRIMRAHHMEVGRDYKMLPIATTGHRYQLMLHNKKYAATMLFPPWSIEAARHGFVTLAHASTFTGPYQSVGGWVRRSWARAHADLLERYLAAYIEGQRWVLDPAHKREIVGLLVAHMHLSRPVAEATYQAMVSRTNGQLEPDARLNTEAFHDVLKLRAQIEGSWGGKVPSISRYYDPTYYDKALASLK